MMVDGVLVESIGAVASFPGCEPKLLTRDEPQEIPLAAAVRAIALLDLRELSLDLERNVSAVATSLVHETSLLKAASPPGSSVSG
jgi:hypothetical protein